MARNSERCPTTLPSASDAYSTATNGRDKTSRAGRRRAGRTSSGRSSPWRRRSSRRWPRSATRNRFERARRRAGTTSGEWSGPRCADRDGGSARGRGHRPARTRRQLGHGERRDDHQVTTAHEHVQLVARAARGAGSGPPAASWRWPDLARAERSAPVRRHRPERAPNSGVSTSSWIGRTNSKTAHAAYPAANHQNGTSQTNRTRSHPTRRASRQNGAMTTTGPSSASADASR